MQPEWVGAGLITESERSAADRRTRLQRRSGASAAGDEELTLTTKGKGMRTGLNVTWDFMRTSMFNLNGSVR